MNPLVSILIPMHNAQEYLEKTLRSVFNQSYKNIEIIIVDDESTDESLSLAKRFEDRNCRVFSQKNAGACAARNLAFAECKGEYIQYLDADDLLSSTKIEKQISILEKSKPHTVASCSWASFTNDKDLPKIIKRRPVDKSYEFPLEWLLDSWSGKGMAANSCWLVPRSIITKVGKWNEKLKMNQDGEFFCRVLMESRAIMYVPEVNVFYRKGIPQSITGRVTKEKRQSQLLSYEIYSSLVLSKEESYRVRHALMCNYLSFLYHYYEVGDDLIKEAKHAIKSLGFRRPGIWGGKWFKLLSTSIGFYNALYFRSRLRDLKFKIEGGQKRSQ